MALILNIDTAVESASVCLAKDGTVIAFDSNEIQKDHAGWLHPAITTLLDKHSLSLIQVDAFAVTVGPGSYTGLRVGLATAKGFCYALQKPLIALNTLQVMAWSVKELANDLICPMIDARRMEVFTAVYNRSLEPELQPQAMLLDENSFTTELQNRKTIFCGNGSKKFKPICHHKNAAFSDLMADARSMTDLSEKDYENRSFADPAYTDPLYLKEFHSSVNKPFI